MGLLDPAERGRRIRTAREAKGWKQWRLAQAVGKRQPTISHWESGRNSPTREEVVLLAEVLEIDPKTLEFDDDDQALDGAA